MVFLVYLVYPMLCLSFWYAQREYSCWGSMPRGEANTETLVALGTSFLLCMATPDRPKSGRYIRTLSLSLLDWANVDDPTVRHSYTCILLEALLPFVANWH
jgi:hypothetical protein